MWNINPILKVQLTKVLQGKSYDVFLLLIIRLKVTVVIIYVEAKIFTGMATIIFYVKYFTAGR